MRERLLSGRGRTGRWAPAIGRPALRSTPGWSGPEAIFEITDSRAGLRAFVVIDSTVRGPSFGGVRIRSYAGERDAILEALDLAAAMTVKAALAELPCGGGKIVVLDHPGLHRARAMAVLGRAIEDLGGEFFAGRDLGMQTKDLEALRRATRYAADESPSVMGDLGDATARGTIAAIRAALVHAGVPRPSDPVLLHQSRMRRRSASPRRGEHELQAPGRSQDPLQDARIIVQGAGAVGLAIVRRLVAAGSDVIVADPAPEAARRAAEAGATLVRPGSLVAERADVFVPAAVGGVVDVSFARRCRSRIVCGPANNALASRAAEEILSRRGVLFVPDPIVGAGALIVGVLHHQRGGRGAARLRRTGRTKTGLTGSAVRSAFRSASDRSRAGRAVGAIGRSAFGVQAGAAIDAIGPRTARFLREIDRTGRPPSQVLQRMVQRKLRARPR